MKYKILLFDADETLFDFKKAEKEAFKNTILEFGINYDESYHFETYKEINTIIWKELEEGLITQAKLKVERFKRLSQKLNISYNENDFAKSYMKNLALGSFLFENAREVVQNLSEKYTLLIITNGLTAVQDTRIRKSEIAKYFKDIIISEEIGISKPNPDIFEYSLKNLDFNKGEVLMIGDSLSSDIKGGINFGIDTCWYNPNKSQNNTNMSITHEVSSLKELEELLLENCYCAN